MKSLKLLFFLFALPCFTFSQVDVSIKKTLISPGPFLYGNQLSFNVEVTNLGSVPVTNIDIIDLIPCGYTYSGGSQIWNPSGNNRVTTITSTINPTQSIIISIDLIINACVQTDAWMNTAQITRIEDTSGNNITTSDSNILNNTDTASAQIFDLALIKTLSTLPPYNYGDILTFNITVSNQGNQALYNILIRDYLMVGGGYIYNPLLNPQWSGAVPILSQTIPGPLLPGNSVTIQIQLQLISTNGGERIWVNYAEIGGAADVFGGPVFDSDSSPGSNGLAENNVLPGSADDNNVSGGGISAGEDEDDHDPAGVAIFDLALTKTQGSALSSFSYLQDVEYVMTIVNQGSVPATNINVTDYLPVALQYLSTPKNTLRGWIYNPMTNKANMTYTKVLLPGQSDTIKLDLRPIQWYANLNDAWTNYAEISGANDTDPNTPGPPADIDSASDNVNGNDAGGRPNSTSDGVINGDATGVPGDAVAATDEDDHDPHKIQLFDLALQKRVITPGTYFQVGDDVTFEIQVYNQGNVPAKNIVIADYIPSGFDYFPGGANAGWMGVSPLIKRGIPAILLPGQNTTIQLTLKVKTSILPGAYLNYAEVSAAQDTLNNNRNDDADSVPDDIPGNDNQVQPGSADDNNILGNRNIGQDEDDHDVAGIEFLCQKPTLTVGIPVCDQGNATYSVTYYSNVPDISTSIGIIAGSKVTGIPIGTNVIITAANGLNCNQSLTVLSPASCPGSGCLLPQLTVGQPLCNLTSYTVSFSNDLGVVSTTAGVISANSIINIPIGTNITVTATNGSCISRVNVTAPVNCGVPCANSPITISGPVCNTNGAGTYSVHFISAPGTIVLASAGTLGLSSVTDIPSGTNLTLTITTPGCDTRVVVVPAGDCPVCQRPTLTVGRPVCNPLNNTYSVLYYSNVANVISSTGVISGSSIVNIPLGTNILVTAMNGLNCSQSLTVLSPSNCPPTGGCTYPQLTAGQPICTPGNTWSVSFSTDLGVVTPSAGNISGNSIINIPSGVNLLLTVSNGNCISRVSVSFPINCGIPCANSPITISGPVCEPNTPTYMVNFIALPGTAVGVNTGTLGVNSVTGIPSGVDLIMTVTTPGCDTRVITVPAGSCNPGAGGIGNFVWHDINGDGQQNNGEPGIPGVIVMLLDQNNIMIDQTTTSANGMYSFSSVSAGQYYLKFTAPIEFLPTFADKGNDNTDSDAGGYNGPGTTALITVNPGQTNNSVDAGFYRCARIGDLVWYDTNKNDIYDATENGINGLKVNLWRNHFGTWIIWDYTFTGFRPGSPSSDGFYNFCAPPGQYYVQVIIPPLGLVQVLPNKGSNPFKDSDLTNANGQGTTNSFSILSGGSKLDIGAGYYPMAIVGNLVWVDENLNGVQESEESKMQHVRVEAYDAVTHEVLAQSITDAEGVYELDYLQKKNVYIKFYLPDGFVPTMPGITTDDKDSDVDHSNGLNTTRSLPLQSGKILKNIDLGLAFGILPVEWLNITAEKKNGHHHINWSTTGEVNASHYVVERKTELDADFIELPAQIKANGNAGQINHYFLEDKNTEGKGIYYYRVKQLDYDGKYNFSKVVYLKTDGVGEISLLPNPARTSSNLEFTLSEPSVVKVELLDAGASLVNILLPSLYSNNGIQRIYLDLTPYPKGVYIVKITFNESETVQKKLIILD
ncbi:MAG: DUF11 domain-containing protein [Saprospiraceae bacterium]|nr:DUF11 domain-containing protein [Saprospiraceae bacterium]